MFPEFISYITHRVENCERNARGMRRVIARHSKFNRAMVLFAGAITVDYILVDLRTRKLSERVKALSKRVASLETPDKGD